MGYCMTLREEDFYISLEESQRGFPIVKKSLLKMRRKRTSPFAWVYDEEIKNAKSLEYILDSFSWEADTDAEGNIISIYFQSEKLGDEKILFDIIAPFVSDNSYIEMSGEDGDIWRWVFKDGKCTEKKAEIRW